MSDTWFCLFDRLKQRAKKGAAVGAIAGSATTLIVDSIAGLTLGLQDKSSTEPQTQIRDFFKSHWPLLVALPFGVGFVAGFIYGASKTPEPTNNTISRSRVSSTSAFPGATHVRLHEEDVPQRDLELAATGEESKQASPVATPRNGSPTQAPERDFVVQFPASSHSPSRH